MTMMIGRLDIPQYRMMLMQLCTRSRMTSGHSGSIRRHSEPPCRNEQSWERPEIHCESGMNLLFHKANLCGFAQNGNMQISCDLQV
ncbi:hypothetical protein P691DRAFT_516915 [Macrolepiota fuliginosa MF-IS2]|uniref:Uncharacterized protein n=1 Tax=Macrolepiota fuliginosa MF-IS2 TaxID=1400762 RepID=A0A9P5X239_9AGAR|nr:hypothetical protein P691DRAFT_516915 [Macrolepiota fuliginosa MF-IS2]